MILVIFFVLGAAIISRLFELQVLERKMYQAQAVGQHTGFYNIKGDRGQIFCQANGIKGNTNSEDKKSLAINRDNWTISANTNIIEDKISFAKILSKNINQTEDQILALLEGDSSYVTIEKNLSTDHLEKIKSLNLKGLSWQNNPLRFYPQADFASQVLGFLGGEGIGQYGVEGFYDDILQGKTGIVKEIKGLNSILQKNNQISLDGSDIYLTIDYNIQLQAESLLKKAKNNLDITAGQIIVLDPNLGKVLALANYPTYDPNQYSKVKDLEIFQNGAIQKLFEPGSIMKPFTMAAAINEGKITPETTYIDTGSVKVGPETINNFAKEKYGEISMTEALKNSVNTGAVFAQQKMEHKVFWDYIEKFGFTQKTGIDLQGEVFSRNESLKKGWDVEYATASFGQGIEITPIQIARAYCALANGGKMVKPYIVEKIINDSDSIYTKPDISDPIISQQTVSQINKMLINVVDEGFGGVAKIPGYYLAGKTGTAQIPLTNGRGYEPESQTIQSFVGYGPALNPQFLILVKLDRPKVPKSSLSAVPIFKELAQYIINYFKIPPDYDLKIENK